MENQLKDYPLEQIISNLRERKVQLYLPKFKLESTIDLKEPLQKVSFVMFLKQTSFDGDNDSRKLNFSDVTINFNFNWVSFSFY